MVPTTPTCDVTHNGHCRKRRRALRIALVNRYAPPDAAPTGIAMAAAAQALAQALPEASIRLYATTACYRPQAPATDVAVRSVTLRRIAGARGPAAGWFRVLIDGYLAVRLAWAAGRWADVVICLTDPPFLPLAVAALRRRNGTCWVEWCMDVYPALFAAAGVISDRHPLFRLAVALWRRLRPGAVICLGAGQARRLAELRGGIGPCFLLPSGMITAGPGSVGPLSPRLASRVTVAYAGTMGAAHDAEPLVALVRRSTERGLPIRFDFAVSGTKAEAFRRSLAGCPDISWSSWLADEDLRQADVHFVSLTSAAADLCLPSKLVTAISLGRPFVFAGPDSCDAWRLFGSAGYRLTMEMAVTASDRVALLDDVLAILLDRRWHEQAARAARLLAQDLRVNQARTLARLAAWVARRAESDDDGHPT